MKNVLLAGIVVLVAILGYRSAQPIRHDPYTSWRGTVRGVLVGGDGLIIKADNGTLVEAYWSGEGPAPVTSGSVEIHGRTTGTSCAYLATVFGQCHPEVRIDSIQP